MSIDIVGAISKVCEIIGPTFFRQCDYVLFCHSHASALKAEIKKMKDASTRLHHKVERAESVGEIIEDDVWTWLSKAEELTVLGNQILQQRNAVSCCHGLLPDPKARYVLGRRTKKSLPDLKDHLAEEKFDEVSFRRVVETVEVKVRSASSSIVRYVDLQSRALILKKIMAALVDNDRIGVYGMGGVGKTTLLKEVEKQAKESGRFDDVVSAFVSQNPDGEAIKTKIVNKLRKLESSSEDEANKKTLLVLLDDLWNKLENTGVQGSKVKVKWVMISRKQDLLTKQMNCHTTFPLGVLEEDEGWSFFAELVSNKVEDLKKNRTTVELLKKCAGLPVSIDALATLWKNKRDLSSSDVLNMEELKLGKESINGSVSLELSYNHLGDSGEEKQAKLMFRIIGLLGVSYVPILTLLKYGVGLGLFGNNTNGNIMERARKEITTSLRILQDSSLLLDSDDSDHVKIHDVVRDVAASIKSRDDDALIFTPDDGMKGWSKEKLRKSTSMYVPYSTIRKLNKGWKCPNMIIFTMDATAEKGDPVELPNSFFKDMVKLKVIHLKNALLTSLPSSIQSDVHNLTTLCLHDCNVENVSVIGELKGLEVLSFLGSDIAELPKEIGGLTKLRMLDLSKCSKLVMIEPGILEKLMRLEELYLKESFDRWEVEGVAKQSNSSLVEFYKLQLSSLEVRIRDARTLPPNLPFGNLVHYKVLIGDAWDWSGEFKEERTLKLKVDSDDALSTGWLQSTLEKTQDLHLDGLGGFCESFHEICRKGFKELKHLHLQNSSSMKYIIWSTNWLSSSSFTILESMNLEKMSNLETIGVGLISSTSFRKLKVIKVHECEKLKNLFSLSLAIGLPELEEIEVSNCNMIREIVYAEIMDDNNDSTNEDHKVSIIGCSKNLIGCPIKRSKVAERCSETTSDAKKGMVGRSSEVILRNLRSLVLRNLTEMITFFTKEAPSALVETNAPTFFNDQQVSLQRSKLLKLFSSSKRKKIQPSVQLELVNLGRLELEDCNKIEHFINSKMLLKLLNLESLTIMRCDSLEDIFDLEGIDAKGGTIEILPKLSELKLRGLPKLQHIWKNAQKAKGCPKLRTIEINQCESLIYLSGSSMCEGLENLMEINMVECGEMKTIFLEEVGLESDASTLIRLSSLKIVVISKCPNLVGFLSGNLQGASMAFKCSNPGMIHWCCGKQDLADTSNCFFSQKVFLPSLETLVLSDAGMFEKLWCNEVPDQSYCQLQFINVDNCDGLSAVFPASLMERLQNLKRLRVENCNSLETVFDLDIMWKTKKKPAALMLTQLEEVRLKSLAYLMHIVDIDSGIVVGFPSLKNLDVSNCGELMYLISATTAMTLLKLETLEIRSLAKLKEVIHGEESGRNKRNVITFPNLTSLNMQNLDNLSCFSSESCILYFTGLKVLTIWVCHNLKTFVKPRLECEGSQAFFNDKVQIPNLEQLRITALNQVEELWCNNEPPTGFFCNLKLINIRNCSRLRNIIPLSMIKRLQNLESMKIGLCESLEDIFNITTTQLEENIEKHTVNDIHVVDRIIRLSKLTSLHIVGKPNLSYLWTGAYKMELPSLQKLHFQFTTGTTVLPIIQKVYLPNLEELDIWDVKDITVLWADNEEPPIGSFCKLKRLKIGRLTQLEKIFPSFMLKRLHSLEELQVQRCDRLETMTELGFGVSGEDISNLVTNCFPFQNLTSLHVRSCRCLRYLLSISEGSYHDDSHGETTRIVFTQLTNLSLVDLPLFSHLHEGHDHGYILEMPSLKKIGFVRSGADDESITQMGVFPKDVQIVVNDKYSFFGSTTDFPKMIIKTLQSHQIIGVLASTSSFSEYNIYEVKEEAIHFDVVVALYRCNNVHKIQESMGRRLDIIYTEVGVQRRAQQLRKSLLSLKEKTILLIWHGLEEEMDLEAIGIPHNNELLHLKQILICGKKEVLDKMGAQEVISSWGEVCQRWRVFEEELMDSELPDDTNTSDIPLFFIGSKTGIINNIMQSLSLHRRQKNDHITALLGRMADNSNFYASFCNLVQEVNMFDDVVTISITQQDVVTEFQEQLGSKLGINYGETSGVHERAQQLGAYFLSNYLADKKRLLIIIEKELEEAIDLEAVGIPRGDELDLTQLNIIVVSNDREVLNKMGAQQLIDIGSIFINDSIGCYRILDGYIAVPELIKLADECGCRDLEKRLAIKLKGQGLVGWANAFERLQESAFTYDARRKVIDSLQ